MPNENAAVLEFAAILGEAIARAHLSGKQAEPINANATVADVIESLNDAYYELQDRGAVTEAKV